MQNEPPISMRLKLVSDAFGLRPMPSERMPHAGVPLINVVTTGTEQAPELAQLAEAINTELRTEILMESLIHELDQALTEVSRLRRRE